MPEMTMQIVVDEADEFAEFARARGVSMQGPTLEHGEKIYFFTAPNGMQMSIQSKDSK